MLFYPLLGIECFHIMSCVWSNVIWHDQFVDKVLTLLHFQESSITDEVEAELRPASNNSSHTPILPSKKIRPPRDDSLPSPRGVAMPGMMVNMTDDALLPSPLSRLLPLPQPSLGHPDQQVHPGPAEAWGDRRRRRTRQGRQAGAHTAQENQVSESLHHITCAFWLNKCCCLTIICQR